MVGIHGTGRLLLGTTIILTARVDKCSNAPVYRIATTTHGSNSWEYSLGDKLLGNRRPITTLLLEAVSVCSQADRLETGQCVRMIRVASLIS